MNLVSDLPHREHAIPLPPSSTVASFDAGRVELTGDFSIHMRDARLVIDDEGSRTFESGNWTEPATTSVGGRDGPARYRHHQSLRLDVTEARLVLQLDGRPLRLAAAELEYRGNWSAVFAVTSLLHEPPEDLPSATAMTLPSGAHHMQTWSGSDDELVLRARLRIEAAGNGRKQPWQDALVSLAGPDLPPSAGWFGSGLVIATVIVLSLHRRAQAAPTLECLERVTLRQDVRRALRTANRFVGRHPSDRDGLFLLGTNLLLAGRHDELMRRLEPCAERMEKGSRRSLAFLLCAAAKHAGDAPRFLRWAQEAAEDPLLLERMRREGVWPMAPPAGRDVPYIH